MAAPANLEEDFRIVRRNYPDVSRSVQSTSSSISSPKPQGTGTLELNSRNSSAGAFQGRTHEWSKEILVRLERLESQQLQSATANAERREECLSLAAQVAELRSSLAAECATLRSAALGTGGQEVSSIRSEFEHKSAHLQSALTAIQAQSEQARLQLSELRNEQAALRERQAARDGECASKILELASCVDEVARQVQELKQDNLTETTLMRSRLEANTGDHDAHLTRLENLEVQQKDEQARLNTESAALKARLQALELRLAAASLEKISAQATSANKAQEQFEVRMARLEAGLVEASKGVPSLQGTTTAASNRSASASVSVASMEDSRGGLAHLVGEMDAELRVEINSRLRVLTADLKGEIMSEVATRLSSAEASVSGIEAKLSSELDHVCEDFKVCLESITKARLVPRLKQLEDQMQSTKLLVATMEAHARNSKPESPQSQEHKEKDPVRRHSLQHSERSQETKEEEQAKHFISNGLRQRLHGLVSALSWTLGQVHAEGEAGEIEGSNTGSGKTPQAPGGRRASDASAAPQRSRISASGPSLRPNGVNAAAVAPPTTRNTGGEPSPDAPPTQNQDLGKPVQPVNRQASLHVAPGPAPGPGQVGQPLRSPPSNGRTMTPQPHSMQAPAYPGMHWPPGDPRTNSMAQPMQGRRPINSMPASRGGSPPLAQRNSMPRPHGSHGMSASASPFQAPAHRSPQLVLSQRSAAQIQYRR